MKVIVANYPKTGTKSIAQALSLLGYKTYDFMEHWWYHGDQWMKILNGNAPPEIFLEMYKDVDAVLDAPAFFFWEEIYKMFPDAKIIITVRNEDSWYESYLRQKEANTSGSKTALVFMAAASRLNPFLIVKFRRYCSSLMRVEFGSTLESHGSEMIDRLFYRHHHSHVIKAAPKDKLLVYNISEGWAPLCQFLDKEQPDVAFPHKNKKASVAEEIMEENPIAIENIRIAKRRLKFLGITVLVALAAYFLV